MAATLVQANLRITGHDSHHNKEPFGISWSPRCQVKVMGVIFIVQTLGLKKYFFVNHQLPIGPCFEIFDISAYCKQISHVFI